MGEKLGCSNKERLFAERRREREAGFSAVSRSEKAVGERERELWGVERRLNKWILIACRACIERCAGLKVQISVTELTACFVHI